MDEHFDLEAAQALLARTDGWLVDGRPITNREMDTLRQLKARQANMVNVNNYFESDYIKHSDLQKDGTPCNFKLVIQRVEEKQFEPDERPVLIVYFVGAKKGLRLNRTNAMAISNLYGPETNGWLGKEITLAPDMTTFMGNPCPCVRVVLVGTTVQTVTPGSGSAGSSAGSSANESEVPF